MVKIGFVILAHDNVFRIRQLVCFLAQSGAPVALHLDVKMSSAVREILAYDLAPLKNVHLLDPMKIEWGDWSIVEATLHATETLLREEPDIDYVLNISGSCLPISNVPQIRRALSQYPYPTDFIESFDADSEPWIRDGLKKERVTLYHPFLFKSQRFLFDRSVQLQRLLKIKRKIPRGLSICFGSQWWCLSRKTLETILQSSDLPMFKAFFRKSWIPDESFFQSLVPLYSDQIVKKSTTYARFDKQGKPHIFYDDHLHMLQSLDYFFARKIWSGANALYAYYLNPYRKVVNKSKETQDKLEAEFNRVSQQAAEGRDGLLSQATLAPTRSKHPRKLPHTLLVGLEHWSDQFRKIDDPQIHICGQLFHGGGIHESLDAVTDPSQRDSSAIRDYSPEQYLIHTQWRYAPKELVYFAQIQHLNKLVKPMTRDVNANILWVQGAWLIPLASRKGLSPENLSLIIKAAQRKEESFLNALRAKKSKAQLHLMPLGSFLADPEALLRHFPSPLPDFDATTPSLALDALITKINAIEELDLNAYMLSSIPRDAGESNVIEMRSFARRA